MKSFTIEIFQIQMIAFFTQISKQNVLIVTLFDANVSKKFQLQHFKNANMIHDQKALKRKPFIIGRSFDKIFGLQQ